MVMGRLSGKIVTNRQVKLFIFAENVTITRPMHNLPIYQVDAFTQKMFSGNPAAVVPMPTFLKDSVMQAIAAENNLSETAFVVVRGPGEFAIRWFTPTAEVRLCGHATIAAAHVLHRSSEGRLSKMHFDTTGAGRLTVRVLEAGKYQLDFPADRPKKLRKSNLVRDILGVRKLEAMYEGQDDLLVILKSQKQIEKLTPDFSRMAELTNYRGVLVSAPGRKHDFVSRCFFPQTGIDEDPVTGSAHTLLAPYWASRLGKRKLRARQLSERGGNLSCQLKGKRVRLTGRAVTYLSGQIHLDKLDL